MSGPPQASNPFDIVLPNGRIVAPVGVDVAVGDDAQGLALTPDGQYAIVSTGDGLTVVDASSMRVVSIYQQTGDVFSQGVAALRDPNDAGRTVVLASGGASNVVHVLDLSDAGDLTQEPHRVAMPEPDDPHFADNGRGFASALAVSADGRTAYVAHSVGDSVSAIDVAQRRVISDTAVGFAPADVNVAGNALYVTNEGLARYGLLFTPARVPAFQTVAGDLERSSSLDVLTLGADGDIDGDPSTAAVVRLDPIPDGTKTVGGAHPSATIVSPNGHFAFVCLTGVDRVEVVSLTGTPRAIGGISMQLYTGWPYGTRPDAIAISRDGKRLYVALAGINAIGVIDSSNPLKLRRLGLVPAGWSPDALALSSDDRYLYVANADGTGQPAGASLQRIDLRTLKLAPVTLSALRYNRVAAFGRPNALVPAIRSSRASDAIGHVVFVLTGSAPFDPSLDAGVTPNLQALSVRYAVADNFYPDADAASLEQLALGGIVTEYFRATQEQSPESYPRAGYIFNSLALKKRSYRDYGALLRLPGFAPGTPGAGGLGGSYGRDVPALGALAGHVDTNYPGWNPQIGNLARADEFVRDHTALIGSGAPPAFCAIWLPDSGRSSDAAETDAALGKIVAYLTGTPQWSSTAVFVLPAQAPGTSPFARGRALVISPYAKRGYLGDRHLSTASALKTADELLGLPPLTLNDLLASDMADFFTTGPRRAARSGPGTGVEHRAVPHPPSDSK